MNQINKFGANRAAIANSREAIAMNERAEPARRTPADYAIEHAGYLANAAQRLLDVRNEHDALVMRQDEEGDVSDEDMQHMQESVGEASAGLRSAIYEFEKRRDRAAAQQPAAAQERVAWASTGATGHKVVAMPGLHKLPYGDYDLFAAPVAAAPVDLDAHGLRALDNCIRDLRRLLELADDFALDDMQIQSLLTAIESMELRKRTSTPAAPGIDLSKLQRYRMASDANDVRNLYKDDTGTWVKIQDVERALIDASPKGGSDVLEVAGWQMKRREDRTFCECSFAEFQEARKMPGSFDCRIVYAMQPTSHGEGVDHG